MEPKIICKKNCSYSARLEKSKHATIHSIQPSFLLCECANFAHSSFVLCNWQFLFLTKFLNSNFLKGKGLQPPLDIPSVKSSQCNLQCMFSFSFFCEKDILFKSLELEPRMDLFFKYWFIMLFVKFVQN